MPAKTDARFVDPYAPADYSFKGYRRGLTPDDHALGKVLRPGAALMPVSTSAKKRRFSRDFRGQNVHGISFGLPASGGSRPRRAGTSWSISLIS